MKLSDEQENIIRMSTETNIVVDSVAGSGKSTMVLHMAKRYPQRKYQLLTYNARLKQETRQRIDDMKLENIECNSYHSWAVKYLNKSCFTDSRLWDYITQDNIINKKLDFDTLVLDECQDMTELYHRLSKIIYDSNIKEKANIIIVGDYRQSIYQFNGASDIYIKDAPNYFNWNDYAWKNVKLSQSFRINNELACLINSFTKTPFIKSNKIGSKPLYYITDPFKVSKDILYLFEKYEPQDIFVLAPSVKGNSRSPIARLSNILTSRGYPLYIPSDNETLNEDIAKGKIVFSSFHQAKGLERPLVIMFGFSEGYFKYFGRNLNTSDMPNTIYVAMTRASKQLVIIQDNKDNNPQFSKINDIYSLCIVKGKSKYIPDIKNKENVVAVTKLIQHIPLELIKNLMKMIKITTIKSPSTNIILPDIVNKEYVSNINGEAIPMHFQFNILKQDFTSDMKRITKLLESYVNDTSVFYNIDIQKIEGLLRYATIISSYKSNMAYKINQMEEYNWLSNNLLDRCIENMYKLNISNNSKFEFYREYHYSQKMKIIGMVDCIDKNNVYEFKCVKELTDEHILQLVIYKYILKNGYTPCLLGDCGKLFYDNYYLYNILTDELLKVELNDNDTKFIFDELCKRKL